VAVTRPRTQRERIATQEGQPVAEDAPVVVIKVGGDVLEEPARLAGLVNNVAGLIDAGFAPIIVHGGGPQVSRLQERLGLTPTKVGGRRVTSLEDLVVVEQAICGEVNVKLCAALLGGGVEAFGCHGASGRMIQAEKRPPKVVSGGGPDPVDFGEVGDVDGVDVAPVFALMNLGLVPVIATLGVDGTGRVFNINADTTVVQLAAAVQARALLMVTGVGGIFRDLDDKSSRIDRVTADEARALINDGVIVGGMIPKVEEALSVLGQGVDAICIVPPDGDGAFVDAARHGTEAGTVIVA
jgi:acetylglutamate kinase